MAKPASILGLLILLVAPAAAQNAGSSAAARVTDYAALRKTKVVQAARTLTPIKVDGNPDEPAWLSVQPATDFYQSDPVTGAPATERTEVRILFDDEKLYVAVVCYQQGPILVSELGRDFSPQDGDQIGILFDTFDDDRDGFLFSTNPAGAQRDQQITGGVRNSNWDGVYETAARVQPPGWTAEFAIPFRTLRFDVRKPVQRWGFNVLRIKRHSNEWNLWSPAPKPFGVLDVFIAGTLEGIEAKRAGRSLYLKPFAVASYRPDAGALLPQRDTELGLDLKYGITPSLTLDATLNTDFSQVEVDEQQINLTRFSLFFPEKRPFFLENFGLFDIGGSAGGIGLGAGGFRTDRPIIPFFSRRVGLSPRGQPLPIDGGLRLTGKLAGLNLGILNMQVGDLGALQGDNWTVLRLKRDLLSRSELGGFLFHRDGAGDANWNRVGGLDGVFRLLDRRLVLSGFAMNSQTEGADAANNSLYLESAFGDRLYAAKLSYSSTGEGFRNDFGFIPRPAVRQGAAFLGLRPRPRKGPVREVFPQAELRYVTDPTGRLLTRFQRTALNMTLHDGATLTLARDRTFERIDSSFVIRPTVAIPSGDYGFGEWDLGLASSRGRPLFLSAGLRTGDFWSGTRREVRLSGGYRPSAYFTTVVNWSRNYVELPQGDFQTDLVGWRIDAGFSPKMFLEGLFQYNSDARTVASQVRYRLIHHPLSDLFLVYSDVRGVRGNPELARTFSLKLTHLLSL